MKIYEKSRLALISHWTHAFDKFGYDDGDGNVETPLIAKALGQHGYLVKYSRWSPHNTIIYSIVKDDVEFMPQENSEFVIGYDDPRNYLSSKILKILSDI